MRLFPPVLIEHQAAGNKFCKCKCYAASDAAMLLLATPERARSPMQHGPLNLTPVWLWQKGAGWRPPSPARGSTASAAAALQERA